MKILQAFSFLSLPHGGGTADRVYKISRILIQRGHDVTIYTSDFDLDLDYVNSLTGVKVYPFHSIINVPGFHVTPGLIWEAAKNLRSVDIIHLHCQRSFQNIVLHHYARKYNVPYIIDAHGSAPLLYKKRLKQMYDFLFGDRAVRDCSKFIADSDLGVTEYKELGINENRIQLVQPSFPIEDFEHLPQPGAFRTKYHIKEKHIVMFLGRIHRIKGIDLLVQAFYELVKRRDDVILVIVGADDGFQAELEVLIKGLELSPKILFTGFLSGNQKLAALVDADVMVQASRYEQHAWAPFEAILCGTPIIVSSHTGAGEDVKMIDAGYVAEVENSGNLAETIDKVLQNPAPAREKVKRAAKYIRENLSLNKRIADYEKLYLSCIHQKAKS